MTLDQEKKGHASHPDGGFPASPIQWLTYYDFDSFYLKNTYQTLTA